MTDWWSRTRAFRYLVAWALCLAAAGVAAYHAWVNLDNASRPDGNDGHVNIDFGGQYALGRMLVAGHAADLYDRLAQDVVLSAAFPVSDQDPADPLRDHERLATSFPARFDYRALETLIAPAVPLAADSPLGVVALVSALPDETDLAAARRVRQLSGPLYPPIHAVVMAPLAVLRPQAAYRLAQGLNLALVFLVGLGAARWSGGKVWWPVATLLLMLFPGFAGTLNLGQNPLVTLGLLGLGWWLVSVGRPGLGGGVWGLLAFKPVWAVTFFAAALATRRWRLALAMGTAGMLLILATLPLGGVRPWFDWLEVGKLASALYERDTNWVLLSRDVQNLPRRYLLDFPPAGGLGTSPHGRLPDVLGVSLWLTVVATWLVVLVRTPRPGWDGPVGAFTLLGGVLACWHFMYYDAFLAALPVFLLLRDPWRAGWVPWAALVLLVGCHYLWEVLDPRYLGPPSETLILLGLWAWCGRVISSRGGACTAGPEAAAPPRPA